MSIQTNFPAIKPTLLLDFANTEQLDPRITFTRASTATYYGAQTAKAEENLLLQSQTFNNAVWVKSSAIVTPERTTAPDNSFTASAVLATGANGTLLQTFTANAVPYTFSVWLLRFTGTGNVDITVDGTTFSTVVPTSSWVRFSVTTTPSAGSRTAGVRLPISGDEFFIWGAQLEPRSSVTAYTPTTTQPITNYIPRLLTAASGVARFDHNPTTFESLGLEIEESRTNLFTYSDQFANAAWTKTNATITANTIVAPDGALTGDKLVDDTAANESHFLASNSVSFTSGTAYTLTCYAKAGERNGIRLQFNSGAFGASVAYRFDLTSGVATLITAGTGTSASATAVGNGWYRCSMTAQATITASRSVNIYIVDNSGATVYTGDGYSGIYIWGAQLEAGAFATSYIPTVASQVTRAADLAVMTGTNFSSWYNQGEGTFFAQFRPMTSDFGANRSMFLASDSTSTNFVGLRYASSGLQPSMSATVSNVSQANISTGAMIAGTSYKLAGVYKVNDFAASRDSAAVATDTSGTVPVVTQAEIGSLASISISSQHIAKLAYYPLRVTNAQLQGLTS